MGSSLGGWNGAGEVSAHWQNGLESLPSHSPARPSKEQLQV